MLGEFLELNRDEPAGKHTKQAEFSKREEVSARMGSAFKLVMPLVRLNHMLSNEYE
jgi:hypothetical protein